MRLWLIPIFLLLVCRAIKSENYQEVDNEFAEFEDFESEEVPIKSEPPKVEVQIEEEQFATEEEDEVVVDDDSEFEHFQDIEEFEGYETIEIKEKEPSISVEPKITITKVPIHFRANWDSYYLEILMLSGLFVYFINFANGKGKNNKIAKMWFETHRQMLEENFCLVGDDGNIERNENVNLVKESENVFTLWCSGRVCCEGMLVELKLIKRQDLVSVLAGMMRPASDQIHVQVKMNREDMDGFVFCVAQKKTATHFAKEMCDISVYCPERKSGEKFNLPTAFNVMGEIAEATSAILDSKITAVLNKYPDLVDYIHISDQYSGVKQPEESSTLKMPETQKVLLFGFNMPTKGVPLEQAMEKMVPLMTMVFYCIDKIKRYRLSKEAKNKADKNRQRVEEVFLKSTHQARAEAAAAKREEKKRLEKEKVMASEDPEHQRRWEEKEEKRKARKKAPRLKQLKVKAL